MALFDIYEARETINDLGYRYKFEMSEDWSSAILITYFNGEVIAQKKLECLPYLLRDDTIAEMSFEVACNHFLESILK